VLVIFVLVTILLIAIIAIDIRLGIIPDILNMALLALGAVSIYLQTEPDWLQHGLSAIALGGLGALLAGPYSRWRGRDMLGWGDVKFLAAGGVWLPLPGIGWFLAVAGAVGVIVSIIYKQRTGNPEAPFAPALCFALWVMVLINSGLLAGLL
jgi:leader peptidase (prepilin peptidase)/N-methyltransferase